MPWLTAAVIVYAVLIAVGGVIGFATAGSQDSLIVGGTIGLLLLGAAAWSKSSPKAGFATAAALTLIVIGIFISRYLSTGKAMPAFGVIGLSAVMLILLAVGHFRGLTATPAQPSVKSDTGPT
jgi:uncharacterized membrane protein (UPF0136 family)